MIGHLAYQFGKPTNETPTNETKILVSTPVLSIKQTQFRNFRAPVVCCVQFERLAPFLVTLVTWELSTREFVQSVQHLSPHGISTTKKMKVAFPPHPLLDLGR